MTMAPEAAAELETAEIDQLHLTAQQIRVDGIRASTKAGSGHPTSSMSAADIITVLGARHLRYDFKNPHADNNDHLIFSKGHASPLLYSFYKACGAITDAELLTYRTPESRLQGHPTPIIPWVDVATGSLGQGLPIAVGVALAGRKLDHLDYHVWVLCGDSEMAEGSMWEAFDKAAYYGLGNLCAIVDINRLGQRGPTELQWNLQAYAQRVESFGCRALVIDGHNLAEIDQALRQARQNPERPTVILARTIKGKGVSWLEDKDGWHGKALSAEQAERAIAELGGGRDVRIDVQAPPAADSQLTHAASKAISMPQYQIGDKVATRKAYGDALQALAVRPDVVVLDGEVGNSTHADEFLQVAPQRYFEMFISEQQMVAAAVGFSVRGAVPFAATFAAFFSRAYDFIRMGAISQANLRLCGSHAGCEIGADGPSQMALEDLASLRAIPGSTILYPSDAVSTAKLVSAMADLSGVSYLRTTRGAYPVLYQNEEDFPVGGSKVLRRSESDAVTVIAAGVTVHEALAAAQQLADKGIETRVIDLYSVKPVDVATVREALNATSGRLVVVEDHYPQGGVAAAVLEALSTDIRDLRIEHLCVRNVPGSGPTPALLEAAGIDSTAIVAAVERLYQSQGSK